MKIKHSVSSPPTKYGQTFFSPKKASHEGTNIFGEIYEGMFYLGTNDQIMQRRGELMAKRFQRSSFVSFPLIDPDVGY